MKNILNSITLLAILISTYNPAHALTMKITPEKLYTSTTGAKTEVKIMIEDATDLGHFLFDITYNPTIVTIENESDIIPSDFPKSTGRMPVEIGPVIDNSAGRLSFGTATYGDAPGPDGNGVLTTIRFTIKNKAKGILNLENVQLADTNNNELLPDTLENAEIIPTYKIAASIGNNGTIDPSGDVIVEHGENQTFVIKPDNTCYNIQDVLADNISKGAILEYTFPDVKDDHTIHATFIPSPPPNITIYPTNPISYHSATLNGAINPNGLPTIYYFEYGTTTAYGLTTPKADAGSGNNVISVSTDIENLKDNTTYFFQLVAENDCVTVRGENKSFTTLPLPILSVTPNSQNVPETSGTANLQIENKGTGTMTWTAKADDNCTWLTTAPNSGTDNAAITLSYEPNPDDERTCSIKISAPTAVTTSPQIIKITQACIPAGLSVSPSSLDIPGTSGTSMFKIANTGGCKMNWTTESNAGWISTEPSSGINKGYVTVTYSDNPGAKKRFNTITIASPDAINSPQTIEVNQACIPSVLSVTPSSLILPETRGKTTFTIENIGKCTMPWKASENADWFSITPHHGTDSSTITVTYETNASTEENTGTITITGSGAENSPLTLEATQAPTTKPLLWETMETPVSENLSSIWGTSENNVFAVGSAGTILHFNGNEWTEMPTSTLYYLRSIWGTSENNVFAVGEQGTILHYDGNENSIWTKMETRTSADLRSIWGSSGSNVFAVSEQGTIHRYDGSNWDAMLSPTFHSLHSIWGSSGDNAFTVGGAWNSFIILHYDGNTADTWTEMPTDALNDIPFSIWGSSQNNVFAVGSSGMIIHYSGNLWKKTDSNTSEYLMDIWGSSRDNVFAAGVEGTILHYNGTGWDKMRTDTSRDLYGIWGSSERDVFVVGRHGTILRYSPTTLVKKTQEPLETFRNRKSRIAGLSQFQDK
ncbi:MAG: hypothetical protein GY795_45460 [Desulfobacterales bacterium]|nr:hypothetical protein [Desulfobacterales bacterium]